MEETILRVKHEMSASIDKTKAEIERAEIYAVSFRVSRCR